MLYLMLTLIHSNIGGLLQNLDLIFWSALNNDAIVFPK